MEFISPISGKRRTLPDIGAFFRRISRGAQAAVNPNFAADEYARAWERENQIDAAQRALLGRIPAPGTSVPITSGLNQDGAVDRTQSDLYRQYAPKPFPMTQEGQYDRYFKTPEFDYVFGAQTGKGPKTAAEMVTLGTQRQAPTTAPLADYYRAQSATGRVNQAAIQEMYKDRPDLQKWAAANPMLAQREYTKKYGTTDITKLASDQETVMGDLGSRFQDENPYKNTPEAFGLPANPVPPTEQRGAEGMTQGQRMDYFRGVENLVPRQAEFTTGSGAPQLQTTFENLLSKAKKTQLP